MPPKETCVDLKRCLEPGSGGWDFAIVDWTEALPQLVSTMWTQSNTTSQSSPPMCKWTTCFKKQTLNLKLSGIIIQLYICWLSICYELIGPQVQVVWYHWPACVCVCHKSCTHICHLCAYMSQLGLVLQKSVKWHSQQGQGTGHWPFPPWLYNTNGRILIILKTLRKGRQNE